MHAQRAKGLSILQAGALSRERERESERGREGEELQAMQALHSIHDPCREETPVMQGREGQSEAYLLLTKPLCCYLNLDAAN
jgi:hypothetical protein